MKYVELFLNPLKALTVVVNWDFQCDGSSLARRGIGDNYVMISTDKSPRD